MREKKSRGFIWNLLIFATVLAFIALFTIFFLKQFYSYLGEGQVYEGSSFQSVADTFQCPFEVSSNVVDLANSEECDYSVLAGQLLIVSGETFEFRVGYIVDTWADVLAIDRPSSVSELYEVQGDSDILRIRYRTGYDDNEQSIINWYTSDLMYGFRVNGEHTLDEMLTFLNLDSLELTSVEA